MTVAFNVVIPAIYDNSDFPNKALVDVGGKPMIQHIYERARNAGAQDVVIATESAKVGMAAEDFGATVCMIVDESVHGIFRLSAVVDKLEWGDDVTLVSVPGDAPLIPEALILDAAENLASHELAECVAMYKVVDRDIAGREDTINMVVDNEDYVMYMSRALLPHCVNNSSPDFGYRCWTGVTAYRSALLRILGTLDEDTFEKSECVQELMLLYNGIKIFARQASADIGHRVTTEDDIEAVSELLTA